ncbi:MAG: cation:proton antiporter [Bdellovibrionota bacterium]
MPHLPQLISDLAVLLVAAALVSLLFKQLKLPVVLGYIITGILIGPHLSIFPTIQDTSGIQLWAEIGVIFLLFSLGLEFSFKKLAQVGISAALTAIIEMSIMISLGFGLGLLLGFGSINSLFLGGIVSISSTSIIMKSVGELNIKGRRFIDNVYGIIIVEDVLAVLLLVLLSTLSISQNVSGAELFGSVIKLSFFLGLWFVLGIFFIPLFLKRVRLLLNDESTLVVSLGLCLLMVLVATHAGFSPALGAFIMGSLLAETADGKNVERVVAPVRDLFAAVFFVSIGILFNPAVISDHPITVISVLALVFGGKLIAVTMASLLSGQSLKISLQSALSLAQMGEFSFIIATLGQKLGVTSSSLYGVAVVVSALTTFTTPFLMKLSLLIDDDIAKKIPYKLRVQMERYQSAFKAQGNYSALKLIMDVYGYRWILNSIIIVALCLALRAMGLDLIFDSFDEPFWAAFTASASGLIVSAPFFAGILLGGTKRLEKLNPEETSRLRALRPATLIMKFFLVSVLYVLVTHTLDAWTITFQGHLVLISISAVCIFLTEGLYARIERQFTEHLSEPNKNPKAKDKYSSLVPWDAVLESFIISPNSEVVAKPLLRAELKEKYGVTVAVIERGSQTILAPNRDELLLPGDKVYVIGHEKDLDKLKDYLETESKENLIGPQFGLETLVISEDSPFAFKPIRSCGVRETLNGLIVGIEREGKRIFNPESSMELRPKDLLWVVGDRDLIAQFK